MKNIILFLLLISLIGCNEGKIEKFDILPLLESKVLLAKNSSKMVKLELCNIDAFKWDKIIVIQPYSTPEMIRSYELDNSRFVEKHMLDTLYRETDCLLLFVKERTIIRHCYVPLRLVDFTSINPHSAKIISKDLACKKLYIRNVNSTIALYSR